MQSASTHSSLQSTLSHKGYAPGETHRLGLLLRLDPGWHTYWINPGDAGAAPRFTLTAHEASLSVGELRWPIPHRIDTGPLTSIAYQDEVFFELPFSIPSGLETAAPLNLTLQAEWLVCENECIPAYATHTLRLPRRAADIPRGPTHPVFSDYQEYFPEVLPLTASGLRSVDSLTVTLPPDVTDWVDFFALPNLGIKPKAPLRTSPNQFTLKLTQDPPSIDGRVMGWLIRDQGGFKRAQPLTLSGPATGASLGLILVFALLGGLLLNVMPCVFPVISMKLLGLVKLQEVSVRLACGVYTLGVLSSMLALSIPMALLQRSGQALGWGFQLQSPGFVMAMMLLFTLLALNFLDLLSVNVPSGSRLVSWRARNIYAQEFFSGVLAVAIAAPCTAPFMGAALGYSLSQPFWIQQLIFVSLGIGVALPFLAVMLFPRIALWLPRPGAWMDLLKRWLAFPFFLTVLWLARVLAALTSIDAAFVLLGFLVLMSSWILIRASTSRKGLRALALGAALATVGAGARYALSALTSPTQSPSDRTSELSWISYDEAQIASRRNQGVPVFIDFTAQWCLTCKANEALTFSSSEVKDHIVRQGMILFKADWTQKDPVITAALQRYGRIGVPLYVYYPANNGTARILPEILTPQVFLRETQAKTDLLPLP